MRRNDIKYLIKRMMRKTWLRPLATFNHSEELMQIINKNYFKTYAEIGVWKGENIRYLLKHCNLDKVICVDHYKGDTKNDAWDGQQIQEGFDFKKVRESIKDIEEEKRVTFLFSSSKESSKKVEDNSLDIVFIDANTSYESTKEDIECWYPKVRKKGILCGHDFNLINEGLRLAVHERFKEIRYLIDDSVWYIIKG